MKAFEEAKLKIKEKLGITEALNKFSAEESRRLNMAEDLLGRKLDYNEKNAIIEAHTYGEKVDGKYSHGDLKAKYNILSDSGFNQTDIRQLMDRGICGKEINDIPGGIFEQFPFLKDEGYVEVRDILGENTTLNDLIGEGQNAIILRNPGDNGMVLKIARGDKGEVDNLLEEVANQSKFYEGWRNLIKSGKLEGLEHFKIPKVSAVEGTSKVFKMEKIEGQSFKTLFYLEHYKKELSDIPNINSLSDGQVENLLLSRKLNILPKDTSHTEKFESTDEGWDFLSSFDKFWNSKFWPYAGGDIKLFLDKMKSEGLYHIDEHAGNFMQNKQGDIYMIDFGRVTIPGK